MCCKVYEVPPIDNKPRGIWCKHCKPGRGCGIWETRPQFCRDFHCEWVRDQTFGDEWKPEKAKFVMNFRENLGVLSVMVDPSSPTSWRREPYHSVLRSMAESMAQKQYIIQVIVLKSVTVIGPEKEFLIGDYDGPLKLNWRTYTRPAGNHHELVGASRAEASAAAC